MCSKRSQYSRRTTCSSRPPTDRHAYRQAAVAAPPTNTTASHPVRGSGITQRGAARAGTSTRNPIPRSPWILHPVRERVSRPVEQPSRPVRSPRCIRRRTTRRSITSSWRNRKRRRGADPKGPAGRERLRHVRRSSSQRLYGDSSCEAAATPSRPACRMKQRMDATIEAWAGW
jgi:hypothetical protein